MADGFDPQLFIAAQDKDFDRAMGELRAGEKRSHWIWYVFPQLAGLSGSFTAARYAIDDVAMAKAYLEVPLLRARLIEAASVVHGQVVKRGLKLERLMGFDVDAQKVVSCLTLFGAVARTMDTAALPELAEFAAVADEIIAAAAEQGFPRCPFTVDVLEGREPTPPPPR